MTREIWLDGYTGVSGSLMTGGKNGNWPAWYSRHD